MNKKDIFDRIMSLPGLCRFYDLYAKYKSILLYIFFGGLTTVISIASFILFSLIVDELISNIISWILAVAFAFVTNRVWVFNSQAKGKDIFKEMLSFYSGRLITLGLEEAILLIFVTWLQFNGTIIKIIAQFIVLVGNYLISKCITFKKGERK